MDSKTFIDLVGQQSYDTNKNKIVSTLRFSISKIGAVEMTKLLELYSYDDGKTECLRLLSDKIDGLNECHIKNYLSLFSYDSGKNKALPILVAIIGKYDAKYLSQLLNEYSYDDGRNACIESIKSKLADLNGNYLVDCLNKYSYDSNRTKALNLLLPHINLTIEVFNQLTKSISDKNVINRLASELKSDKGEDKKNDPSNVFTILDGLSSLSDGVKFTTLQTLFEKKAVLVPSIDQKVLVLKLK